MSTTIVGDGDDNTQETGTRIGGRGVSGVSQPKPLLARTSAPWAVERFRTCITCGRHKAAQASPYASAASDRWAGSATAGAGPGRSPQAVQHCLRSLTGTQTRRQMMEGGRLASRPTSPRAHWRSIKARRPGHSSLIEPQVTRGQPDAHVDAARDTSAEGDRSR